MDILLFLWILFAGVVPPAVVGIILLYYQHQMAKKQLEVTKQEIRDYAKGELLNDIGEALSNRLNAIFGGLSKQGSLESQEATIEYARQNPGIANLLTSIAGRAGARWLGKKLGVPKQVADQLAFVGVQSPVQFGNPTQKDDINKYKVE